MNKSNFRISVSDSTFDTPEYRAFELAVDELLKANNPTKPGHASSLSFAADRVVAEIVETAAKSLGNTPEEQIVAFVKIAKQMMESLEATLKAQAIMLVVNSLPEEKK